MTTRPHAAHQTNGIPERGHEDHTHTVRRRTTSCRRRLVAPPHQRSHPTTNEKTTHMSERRIIETWTERPHTQFRDGLHDVDGDWSRHQASAHTRPTTSRSHTATNYQMVDRKTTRTVWRRMNHVDGDWLRHQTSARDDHHLTDLTGQSDRLPERGQEDHTHSSATDYIMSTATGRATRPPPTPDQHPEDHAQLRATNCQMVDRMTTHRVWRRIESCGWRLVAPPDQRSRRPPTIRPHTAHSDGLPERGQEDHTDSSATDYIMSTIMSTTATGRATRPAPAPDHQPENHTQLRARNYQMVDRKTTHRLRRRIA